MKFYKLYLCVYVFCENLKGSQIDLCSKILTDKIQRLFGDNLICEVEYIEDDSVLNIQFGINSDKDLVGVDEILLELSEELTDHLKGQRGLKLNPGVDLNVRLVMCDFTAMAYQSYEDGDYDSGHMAGGDGYDAFLQEMKKEITKRKKSSLKDWLNS
jgi:hypothetical protein